VTAATAANPGDAPRLARLQITDFRAFPKGHPGILDLDGCNLLAFGENGAGKSSFYRALRGLFSDTPIDIAHLANVYSDLPAPSVRAILTDGTALTWTAGSHPTSAVSDTARRSAFLTHTRLREMNYSFDGPDTPPNLFDVAVTRLLADFEAAVPGGGRRRLGLLWDAVVASQRKGARRNERYKLAAEEACSNFNEGMRQALDSLEGHAKPLLKKLLSVLAPDSLELLGLTFIPLAFNRAAPPPRWDGDLAAVDNRRLVANVQARAHSPPVSQDFLNEGRQSALAIALCLAARLACVPLGRDRLKLLVMDDLLISLDASHRRPVISAILSLFADWQIILLTHDRYWFELAREQLPKASWKVVEIYEHFDSSGLLCPLIRPVVQEMEEAVLVQAEAFLHDHHPAAAANYARSACELMLKRYCVVRRVKFPYFEDGAGRPTLQRMLEVAMNQSQTDRARFDALKALKAHRRLVLNPYSHDPANPVPAADVEAAIMAVREVGRACADNYAFPAAAGTPAMRMSQ
jgi:hypothetical protein